MENKNIEIKTEETSLKEKTFEFFNQNQMLYDLANKNLLVKKRNGTEVPFDAAKIRIAIMKANASVSSTAQIDNMIIESVVFNVTKEVMESPHILSVEDIQDMVIHHLLKYNAILWLRCYDYGP